MLKKHLFFLSCFDRFGEKSQKLLLKDNFQIRDFITVFENILQNGQNKIVKKVIFEDVPFIPLDL